VHARNVVVEQNIKQILFDKGQLCLSSATKPTFSPLLPSKHLDQAGKAQDFRHILHSLIRLQSQPEKLVF
jgi:hypothetical protein